MVQLDNSVMRGIAFSVIIIFFMTNISCTKDSKVHEKNIEEIEKYLTDNGITAQKTESGLYYSVTKVGDGNFPTVQNNVKVNYKGYLTNKSVFDNGQNVEFPLANVIKGWQEGIPKFSRGGAGYLFIPSSLGYGSAGAGTSIPGDAVLIFEVDLVDFQ